MNPSNRICFFMPHSLLELNGMSEAELRSLGEELNIKNAKKLALEDLGFAILDAEAVIESQKPVKTSPRNADAPVRRRPERKKRNRRPSPLPPRKNLLRTSRRRKRLRPPGKAVVAGKPSRRPNLPRSRSISPSRSRS